jgi:hypothetical protein
LGRGVGAGRVLGVDAEGVGIPGIKRGKGVTGGGLGQDDGGADVVSASEVIIEVARISGNWVPGECNGVSGFAGDVEVGRRRRLGSVFASGRRRGCTEDCYK